MKDAFNPDLFVAKWYCSKAGPENMPEFAADALEAGYDGPALRRLAGLIRPTSMDIGDLFQRALDEIGTVKIQSQLQGVYCMSRIVATDIVECRIDPVEGAGILAEYAIMANYPPVLTEFLALSEMPMWGDYAPSRDKLVQDIIEQARELVAYVPG